MDLTILIATYNRAESLRRALGSLAACDVPSGLHWEVCVVDNGSTDHTPGGLPVKYVYEPARGKSHALNTGVKASSGEVVAFTDDDVLFDHRYLYEVWEGTRRHGGSSCFACRVLPQWPAQVPAWLVADGPFRVAENNVSLAYFASHFQCVCMMELNVFHSCNRSIQLRILYFPAVNVYCNYLAALPCAFNCLDSYAAPNFQDSLTTEPLCPVFCHFNVGCKPQVILAEKIFIRKLAIPCVSYPCLCYREKLIKLKFAQG